MATTGTDTLSVKILLRTEGTFCVRAATNTTVLIEQDGVENGVSIDHVTKMLRRPGDTVAPATPKNPEEEAVTTGAEFVVHRIVGPHAARGGTEYRCTGMAIPPRKTPTRLLMGFHSRSSTGTGVRASNDGPHAGNHALGRASSHRSDDWARAEG